MQAQGFNLLLRKNRTHKHRKIDNCPVKGLGVRYDIFQKLSVKLEPNFSYGLLDIDNEALAYTNQPIYGKQE